MKDSVCKYCKHEYVDDKEEPCLKCVHNMDYFIKADLFEGK